MTMSHSSAPSDRPGVLDIPGTWNARDVGGRAVPRGSRAPLRTGVLVRTASLSRLTDEGVEVLDRLGVVRAVDLRGDEEVERDGADRLPASAQWVRRTMNPGAGFARGAGGRDGGRSADTAGMIARLAEADDPQAVARRMMVGVYDTFVLDPSIRAEVGAALTDIATGDGVSIVHCSAGKDRTGWIVALLQYVCGVEEDDRLEEYMVSAGGADGLAAAIPPIPGLDPSALEPLLTVEPGYLDGAWENARRAHGGIDGYLAACGLDARTRDRLVTRFVV